MKALDVFEWSGVLQSLEMGVMAPMYPSSSIYNLIVRVRFSAHIATIFSTPWSAWPHPHPDCKLARNCGSPGSSFQMSPAAWASVGCSEGNGPSGVQRRDCQDEIHSLTHPQWHTCFVLRLYVGSSIRILLSVLWQLVDSVDCFLSRLIQVSCQKNAETIVVASLTQIWVSSSLSWAQSAPRCLLGKVMQKHHYILYAAYLRYLDFIMGHFFKLFLCFITLLLFISGNTVGLEPFWSQLIHIHVWLSGTHWIHQSQTFFDDMMYSFFPIIVVLFLCCYYDNKHGTAQEVLTSVNIHSSAIHIYVCYMSSASSSRRF